MDSGCSGSDFTMNRLHWHILSYFIEAHKWFICEFTRDVVAFKVRATLEEFNLLLGFEDGSDEFHRFQLKEVMKAVCV